MNKYLAYILVLAFWTQSVSAQTKGDLQARKQQTYKELKLARELMEKTSSQKSLSLRQILLLQKGIESRSSLISTMEQEVRLVDREIDIVNAEIRGLEQDNIENREEYARLIYFAYRNHTPHEKFMYLLAASSLSQSYQRYRYLKYITEYREQKAEEIMAVIDTLEMKEELLFEKRNDKLSLLEEKESEQNKLEKERVLRQSKLRSIQNREAQLRKQIRDKERIAGELDKRIREIIEEEARLAREKNKYAALTPEQELIGKDFMKNKGKLPWPVEQGLITVGFGPQEIEGLRGSSVQNNGIDISSVAGARVRAIFEGEVTKVFAILGANYTVLIRHGEYLTVYQNLVNLRVKTGDKVLTKEVLGEAFTDEDDNIANIHFELRHERKIMNPVEWISK